MAAHKLLPGRTVALEALLDQLGILLQRLISLESWYGDMRDYPRSISRKPRAAYLGLPYYGTKSACEMFPLAPNPVAAKQSPHLNQQPKERQEMSEHKPLPEDKPTLEELVARIPMKIATLKPTGANP